MKLQVFQEGNELLFHDLKWVLPIDQKLSRRPQIQNLLTTDMKLSTIHLPALMHIHMSY